jgi:hypothetical protein
MTSGFKTPTSFTDFDKLSYRATFTKDGTVVVKRFQGRVGRGTWEFKFTGNATWVCIECHRPWVKNMGNTSYSLEFVPEPVALKAKEFLVGSLMVNARAKQ